MKKNIIITCISSVLAFGIGFGAVALFGKTDSDDITKTTGSASESEVLQVKNMTESISITSSSFFPDNNALFEKINLIQYGIEKGLFSDKSLASELEAAIRELEQLGYYYDYIDKTFIENDGSVYGAKADARGPIGGGAGYTDIITKGTYEVYDDNTFYDAANKAKSGDVIYVRPDAVIDLSDMKITDYPTLQIKEGVTIASNRGKNGSTGGKLIFSLHLSTMFKTHNNVRITGLVLQGSDASTHEGEEKYVGTLGILAQGAGVIIDNCEISGFNGSAINATVGDVYIHHCYIHHCRGENQGAGILITKAKVTAEYNLFSNCRNAIKLSGAPVGELIARNNVEVGNSLEEVFKIGSGSINSALNPELKQTANRIVIANNTILGSSVPYSIVSIPEKEFTVENNIFSLPESGYKSNILYGGDEYSSVLKPYYTIRSNVFGITAPLLKTYSEADASARPAETGEAE